mgnify:CR=1 FL=1
MKRKSHVLSTARCKLHNKKRVRTTLPALPLPRKSLAGISLIEILISMFVLLFGLLGVASIFPVGSHYMNEGEKFDLSSALAQNAFEEMGAVKGKYVGVDLR